MRCKTLWHSLAVALNLIGTGQGASSESVPRPRVFPCTLGLALAAILSATQPAAAGLLTRAEPARSVLKIHVTSQRYDIAMPWQKTRPGGGTGSGFIVGKRRILTNAHVISDARVLQVQKDGAPERVTARILFVADDCDLAMLTVDDPAFFEGTRPLPLARAMPALNDEVTVLGYPMGGDRLSITRGVVSRIDYSGYAHSGVDQHLALQVDAAINPGNSGGPVMFRDRVIGLAFQGIADGENLGYAIPLPVLERFLTDIADDRYDGYPELGVAILDSRNPALRTDLGLGPEQSGGVALQFVDPFGSAQGRLFPRDVLLSVDRHPIAADGSIRLASGSVVFAEVLERKQCGETVRFDVWRSNRLVHVEVPLRAGNDGFVFRHRYNYRPRFAVRAGLVFQPLSREWLLTRERQLGDPDVQRLAYHASHAKLDDLHVGHREFVVLTSRLAHGINAYADPYINGLVATVNGRPVGQLEDLVAAWREPTNGFHVLTFAGREDPLVIDARAAALAQHDILDVYGVQAEQYLEDAP